VISGFLIADLESAFLSEPSQRSLYDKSELAQTTAMDFAAHLGDQRLHTAITDTRQDLRSPIGSIALEDLRPPARSSQETLNGRDGVQEIQRRHGVVDVGRTDLNDEGNPVGVCYEMAFTASFGSVGWVWPGVDPPKTARIEALSTTARDQSISPKRPKALRRRWCSSPQMPSAVQRSSRLQHVQPLPQPNSAGRSFQGIPDFRTNRMPAKHLRSGTRGRPPLGRGTSIGRSGAISFQSSPVTRMEDMSNPLSLGTHRHFLSIT